MSHCHPGPRTPAVTGAANSEEDFSISMLCGYSADAFTPQNGATAICDSRSLSDRESSRDTRYGFLAVYFNLNPVCASLSKITLLLINFEQ